MSELSAISKHQFKKCTNSEHIKTKSKIVYERLMKKHFFFSSASFARYITAINQRANFLNIYVTAKDIKQNVPPP